MSSEKFNQQIIEKVIETEGGEKATNFPHDPGGRTQYGISERSHPDAWADGKVTHDEARSIYEEKYLRGPGFDKITDERLRHQLVDFGVHSGPPVAITKLQEILRVSPDGVLGPKTLAAIQTGDPKVLTNKLAIARLKMMGSLISKRPKHAADAAGWINRATEFILP